MGVVFINGLCIPVFSEEQSLIKVLFHGLCVAYGKGENPIFLLSAKYNHLISECHFALPMLGYLRLATV